MSHAPRRKASDLRVPGGVGFRMMVWLGAVLSTCVLSVCTAFAAEEAAPYAISERIGDVIDGQERDYFGLFPDFGQFVEARTYKTADGRVVIVAQRQGAEGPADSTIMLSEEAVAELRRYIENLEPIIQGETTTRWDIIYHVAKLPDLNLGRKGRPTKIVTAGGQEWGGELLFVSREIVLLWQGGTRYRWDSAGAHVRVFAPAEVRQIRIDMGTNAGMSALLGAGGGLLIGYMVMYNLDASNSDEENAEGTRYCARDYLTVSGILGGVGLVGGFLYGAGRGSEDEYDVNSDPSQYGKHFEAIRQKAIFSGVAPPEFRQYGRAAVEQESQ